MQHCFADNMVDRKLYVIVIVIANNGLLESSCVHSVVRMLDAFFPGLGGGAG